jgi:hypothetical protein
VDPNTFILHLGLQQISEIEADARWCWPLIHLIHPKTLPVTLTIKAGSAQTTIQTIPDYTRGNRDFLVSASGAD